MKLFPVHLRPFLHAYAMLVLMVYAVLLLSSWVVSIYVDEVNALLSPRGIRWMCSSVVSNFASAPLAASIMIMMAVGVVRKSGVKGISLSRMTMKKKAALRITSVMAIVIMALFSLLLFSPNAVLLSAFGTISNSSFSHGWLGLLVLYVIVISSVYGYTSGHFCNMGDIIEAHATLFSYAGSIFVCLFLSSQLVCAIDYTAVMEVMGDDGTWRDVISALVYYTPLAISLMLDK